MTNLKKAQLGAIVKGIKSGVKAAKGAFTAERVAAKEAKLAKIAEEAAKQRKAEIARKAAQTRKANAEKKAAAAATSSSKPKATASTSKKTTTTKTTKPAVAKAPEKKSLGARAKSAGKTAMKYGAVGGAGYAVGVSKRKSNSEVVKGMK